MMVQWIPSAGEMTPDKQPEQKQIVGNHAGPCADQACMEEGDADEGADNADSPHPNDIEDEWKLGFSDALHKSFHNNGIAIERLRDSHHT